MKDKPVDSLEFQRLVYTEIGRHIDLFEKCRRRMIDLVCCALFPPTDNVFLTYESDAVDQEGQTSFGTAVSEAGLSDHFEQSIVSLSLGLDKLGADQICRISVAVVSRCLYSEISAANAISGSVSSTGTLEDPEVKKSVEKYRDNVRDILNYLQVVHARFEDCIKFRNRAVHGIWSFPNDESDADHLELFASLGEIKLRRAQVSDIEGSKAPVSDYIEVNESEISIEKLQEKSIKLTMLISDIASLKEKVVQVWIDRMSGI